MKILHNIPVSSNLVNGVLLSQQAQISVKKCTTIDIQMTINQYSSDYKLVTTGSNWLKLVYWERKLQSFPNLPITFFVGTCLGLITFCLLLWPYRSHDLPPYVFSTISQLFTMLFHHRQWSTFKAIIHYRNRKKKSSQIYK